MLLCEGKNLICFRNFESCYFRDVVLHFEYGQGFAVEDIVLRTMQIPPQDSQASLEK